MTNRAILAALVAIVSAIAVVIVLHPFDRPVPLPPVPAAPERDDPRGHAERELLRLRDPATGRIPDGIRRRELAFASTIPSRHVDALLRRASAPTFDFRQRGPSNVGGRTRALAFDVTDSSVILAGGITGGMWRSSDRGLSWRRTTLAAQLPSVTWVAQDTRPGHTGTWYYGTGEYRTNSTRFGNAVYAGDGIFKSTDGGLSFTQLPSTVRGTPEQLDNAFDFVNRIAIDPSNLEQEELYAACVGAIMRSVDGGATWQPVLGSFDATTGYTDVAVSPTGVVYAAIGSGSPAHGLWRSDDGITWDRFTPEQWGDSLRRASIAIAPGTPETVYVLAYTPGAGKSIRGTFETENLSLGRLVDGVWQDRSANIPTFGDAWDYTSLSGYAFFVTVHPSDPNTVLLGGANLFVSRDGFSTASGVRWIGGYGQDWSYGEDGTLHPDQHIAIFDPDDATRLWVGNDGGVYRTADWRVAEPFWEQRNTGYVTTQFYTVALDPLTPRSRLVSAGAQDNGTLVTDVDDVAAPWAWVRGGDGAFTQIAEAGRVWYVSSQYEGLVRYELDDRGEIQRGSYLGGPGTGAQFVNPYTLDHSDHSVLYYAAGRRLARNRDLAADTPAWELLEATAYTGGGLISAVASSTANPSHRVWYGTADGRAFVLDGANTGSHAPRQVTSPLFPQGGYINCIAVDPRDADRAVVVFSNYSVVSLFLTEDAGTTWTPIAGNLEQRPDGSGSGPSCRWAEFLHTGSTTVLFVGTSTGLYSTTALDGAATTWRQEGAESIGNVIVDMIDTRESDGEVVVATWGNGIFSATAQASGVTIDRTSVASLLGAIVPNPVRASGMIPYVVPPSHAASAVRLTLVDVAGRDVRELYAGRPGAGAHRLRFDASGLAAGMYYYRLAIGELVETRAVAIGSRP